VGREIGPWLIGLGVVIAVVGVLAWTGAVSWFGRLPGDIRITSGNTRVFIPLTTMLLLSLVVSLFFAIFRRR
jgi:NAD/NADP transhydrogenase beta subunit